MRRRLLLTAVLSSLGLAGCVTGPPAAAPAGECAIYLAVLEWAAAPEIKPSRLSTVAITGGRLEPHAGMRWLVGHAVRWPGGRADMAACPGFTARAAALKITLVTPSAPELSNPGKTDLTWISRPAVSRDGRSALVILGAHRWTGFVLEGTRTERGWRFDDDGIGWMATVS